MADPVLFRNGYVAFTTSTSAAGSYTEVDANKSVQFPLSKAELDDRVMGDVAEVFYPGLISLPLTLTHRQDFGASGIDQKFYALWNNGTAFRVKMRPVDAAVSTTNPSYQVTKARVFSITPISGAHGELLQQEVQIRACSGATLVRSTST